MKKIKWAVIGTGVIANEMAQALNSVQKNIYSVATNTFIQIQKLMLCFKILHSLGVAWEKTDRVDALKAALGL